MVQTRVAPEFSDALILFQPRGKDSTQHGYISVQDYMYGPTKYVWPV